MTLCPDGGATVPEGIRFYGLCGAAMGEVGGSKNRVTGLTAWGFFVSLAGRRLLKDELLSAQATS